MKRIAVVTIIMLIVGMSGFFAEACTTILVGKDASVDGSTMVTHTCDGSYDARVQVIPGQEFAEGAMVPVYKDLLHGTLPGHDQPTQVGEIPQVKKTYTYFHTGYPFMNEHQIMIGEDTFNGRDECFNDQGMMMIEMLEVFALQRAKTAREAIQVMGELAEKYGYGDGGETLTLSDGNEAWMFDIIGPGPFWTPDSGKPGAVWAAVRLADDQVTVAANRSRIGKLDLANSDYYMASANVVAFAEEMGWYDKAKDGDFLFWKAYNPDPYGAPYYQRRREWRVLSLLAPSLNLDPYLNPETEQYPFSVKPDKKVSVQDLMAIKRDYYEGTEFDMTKGLAAGPFACPNRYPTPKDVKPEYAKDTDWERTISIFRCSYSFIGQSRSWLPPAIGGVLWFGEDAPHSTCYIPIYSGVMEMPKPFSSGTRTYYDKEYAWWVFDFVSNFADLKFSYMIQDIKAVQQELEGQFFAMQPGIEAGALKLHEEDPEKAKVFLTNYTKNMAMLTLARWRALGDELVYKYNDGYVDNKQVGYPTEWLEAVDYGKTNVVPAK